MSFLFDDDNDDNAFSQSFRTSSQRQVTFSQSSSSFPSSQLSSLLSPEKPSQSSSSSRHSLLVSPPQSQQQPFSQTSCLHVTAKREDHNSNTPKFMCQMCGTVDDYYIDDAAGGLATCNKCFTQSQTFGGVEEELDYEETMHIMSRNRDGTIKRTINNPHRGTGKTGTNPDGTIKRGRPAVPLEDLDKTRKPPSLEECLAGFQTVLQKSCRIMCFDLISIPVVRSKRTNRTSVRNDDDESDEDVSRRDDDRKKELYQQVSKNLKKLWKTYLLSWKEGANYYSALYPQIRFSLRDPFLPGAYRRILNYTLAARAKDTLTEKIRKEVREEEPSSENDSESYSSSDSQSGYSEDDASVHRVNKKMKIKREPSDEQGIKNELDVLFDLFHNKVLGTTKVKSEQDGIDYRVVIKREGVSVTDGASIDLYKKNETEINCGKTDEISFAASELYLFDSAEINSKTMISRKRKRMLEKEKREAMSSIAYDKMIYYHNKLLKRHLNSKGSSMVGRKEAALMLRPSMKLVLGLLLVAAAPYGVTEGQLVGWVQNGSLPILHAFSTLLSEAQRETLSMTAPFFTLPITPTASNLCRIAKKVHVACDYRPPVPVVRKRSQKIITADATDFEPGRLIYPSAVPLILGQLVSDLGFSQRVLNYSLALMGLPVARSALTGASESRERQKGEQRSKQVKNDSEQTEWLPPRLFLARPDKLADIHQILAVVVVACKLIPDWEKNHRYVFSGGRHLDNHDQASDRFVPWTQEQFGFIRSGRTESDYLDFLEKFIFRGKKHALPKFIESLNKSSALQIDDRASRSVDSDNEESRSDSEKSENCRRQNNTVLIPNELVLGWKNNQTKEKSYYKKITRLDSMDTKRLYRPTTLSDIMGLERPNGPLGPLIEYIAVKTEACPDRILERLIELDKELVLRGKSQDRTKNNTYTFPLDLYYHHIFMEEDRPSSKKKSKTPPETIKIRGSPRRSASTKKNKYKDNSTDNDSDWEVNNDDNSNWEFFLTEESPRTDEHGRRCILTQRSTPGDDGDHNSTSDVENDSNMETSPSLLSPRVDEHVRNFLRTQKSSSSKDPVGRASPPSSVVAVPV